MRLALITHGLPPEATGGTEIHVDRLARRLAVGHEVLVLSREGDPARDDGQVRRFEAAGYSVASVSHTHRDLGSYRDAYLRPRLADVALAEIEAFAPDMVWIHHLAGHGLELGLRLAASSVPTALTLHDYWLMCPRGQLWDRKGRNCDGPPGCTSCLGAETRAGLYPLRRFVPAPLRRRASAWVAADEGELDRRWQIARRLLSGMEGISAPSAWVAGVFGRAGVDGITHLPLGVETDRFERRVRTRLGRVGFLGSLIPTKGADLVLDAAEALGELEWVVAGEPAAYHGDDRYAARLMERLRGHGVVQYLGGLNPDAVPAFLDRLDVLVVPSLWAENAPQVVAEARAAGVVVVASAIGGILEMIRDGEDGALFAAGDAPALIQTLKRLRDTPGLMERLSSAIPEPRSLQVEVEQAEVWLASLKPKPKGTSVTAVVLSRESRGDLELCLSSLNRQSHRLQRIVVVDAEPEPLEDLPTVDPPIEVLRCADNPGYAAGNNRGIDRAQERGCDWILIVNPDAYLAADALERLLAAASDRAGVVGPLVLDASDPTQVQSTGLEVSPASGRTRLRSHLTPRASLPDALSDPDAVAGCAMLVRADFLDRAGGLDSEYFLGFEDVELGLRAREWGYRVVFAPEALALHRGSRPSADRLYYGVRNHLRLAKTYWPKSPRRNLSIVALSLAHGLLRSRVSLPAALSALFAGIRDHARGRYGPRMEATRLSP